MALITETTDAAGSRATSYAMGLGDVFLGTLGPMDADCVKVMLTAGQTVTFGALGVGGKGLGFKDPFLRLTDKSGTVLATDDDGGPGYTSSLTWTAATTGEYFLKLRYNDHGGSHYALTMSAGTRMSLTPELGAAMLYRGGDSWSAAPGTGVNVSWGFRDSGPALDAENHTAAFSRLNAAQREAGAAALSAFSDVSGLSFTQVNPGGFTNDATILMGAYTSTTDGAGAYAWFPGSTASSSQDGDLWLNLDSVSTSTFTPGGYSWYVMLHELGHAMGLDHPGDYNAAPGVSITYANSAQYVQDSGQYSVMSYFDATDTSARAPAVYCQTLMMHDIAALQVMYGVNSAVRAGATVYGFRSTEAGSVYDFSSNATPLLCIWDGGGADTLDLSGYGRAQRIDLRAGAFSDVMGYVNNLSIALGVSIENATGGAGQDRITGNELANLLRGGGGMDRIAGGGGNDRLFGGTGADHFIFAAGDGVDRVMDFASVDLIDLSASLWGGIVKTAAEVVADFAVLRSGHVVLDFGADELHLVPLTSTLGLDSHILIV